MVRVISAVVFSVLLFSIPVAAYPPGAHWCGLGYHRDSFGRGIESGFKGGDLRPKVVDESCYNIGIRTGVTLLERDLFHCEHDFNRGYAAGFAVTLRDTASECYNAGYESGMAALDVGAREGDVAAVGPECVDQYKRGNLDSQMHLIAKPPTREPEASCYRIGYFDATSIR